MGASCKPAGAFLAIRSMLQHEDVDVADVRPSTPLHEYTCRHFGSFIQIAARLTPGSMPDVRINDPVNDLTALASFVGWLMVLAGMAVGALTSWHLLTIAGTPVAIPALLMMQVMSNFPPRRVSFGNLATFGDLARVMAAHSPN
jgi:hypothetical protein